MRVLVVGGAGFLGSHLVDRLLAEDHVVDVIDDLSSGTLANLSAARTNAAGRLKFHHLGVDAEELDELVARREPEVIVHLAALPRLANERAVARLSLGGTLNVLEAARATGAAKVVVTLPARHLYGDVPARELPVKDGRSWEPVTVRGVLARAVADLLAVYRQEHGLEFTALAMTNVYGPRQRPDQGVVASFCAAASSGSPARIDGDGRQTRDLLFVDDAVDALVRSTERGSGLVVNVGTGQQTTIRELQELTCGGSSSVVSGPRRAEEPGRFAVSTVRARIHLNWSPWTPLDVGIEAVRASSAPAV